MLGACKNVCALLAESYYFKPLVMTKIGIFRSVTMTEILTLWSGAKQYFWRTWKGSEIDLVEERDGKYYGYEAKWNPKKTVTVPKEWLETYGDQAEWQVVTPENLKSLVSP